MVSHKGLDLVKEILDGFLANNDVQFVILGSGDWEYENFFKSMQEKYPKNLLPALGLFPSFRAKFMPAQIYSLCRLRVSPADFLK